MIEGGVDDPVFPVLALCQFQDLLLDLLVEDDACLDLNVDQQPGGLKKIKNFFHCRDLYTLISGVSVAEIQPAELVKSKVFEPAFAAAGAVDGLVVADNDHAVLGHLDIQFDPVGAHVSCHLKGGQCIFRSVPAGTPMPPDQGIF